MELGDTPVEHAFAWVMRALRDGVTEDDARARFTPRFLEKVPAETVVKVFEQLGAQYRDATIESVERHSNLEAVAILVTPETATRVSIGLEAPAPNRIDGLLFKPHSRSASNWDALIGSLMKHDWCESALDASIAEWITKVRDEAQIPGLVAGVVRNGELVHRQALGVGNLEKPSRLDMSSIFRAGSVSKIVTTLAILRLADEGVLKLDDPVQQHLKSVKLVRCDETAITIRHVLTHTSGLPRHQDELDSAKDFADAVGGELRAVAPPGQENVYSNIGFGMLGQIIADVTQVSYAEHMEKSLFQPLGMTDTSIARAGTGPVRGHDIVDGALQPVEEHVIADEGAGALCSTVEDLATLAIAVSERDPRVCDPGLLTEAMTPTKMPGAGPTQGLGFQLWQCNGYRVPWHNGGLHGWKAAWYITPEANTAVIVVANRFHGALDELARALTKDLL